MGICILNRIIIASKNTAKIAEIKSVLRLKNIEYLDLGDLLFDGTIEESGSTFRENALIKAAAVYNVFRLPVIADDSGLVVPLLGGQPGVYSARFSGPRATDEQNNDLLLRKLQDIEGKGRKAWFACVALFYHASGEYNAAEGKVHGYISNRPAGSNGFGYDPLFFLPEYGKTMAQLPGEEKNRISHRGKAFRELRNHILAFFKEQRDGGLCSRGF
jgi:XTP/dITP diphosphohydrolase